MDKNSQKQRWDIERANIHWEFELAIFDLGIAKMRIFSSFRFTEPPTAISPSLVFFKLYEGVHHQAYLRALGSSSAGVRLVWAMHIAFSVSKQRSKLFQNCYSSQHFTPSLFSQDFRLLYRLLWL